MEPAVGWFSRLFLAPAVGRVKRRERMERELRSAGAGGAAGHTSTS